MPDPVTRRHFFKACALAIAGLFLATWRVAASSGEPQDVPASPTVETVMAGDDHSARCETTFADNWTAEDFAKPLGPDGWVWTEIEGSVFVEGDRDV